MTIRKSSNSGIPFGINSGRPANPQPGQPYFNGEANRLEIYTQTVGWQNIVQETPSVVNVIGALNENASSTITINGTNFAVGCIAYVVGTNGVETVATSTSLVSVVQLTATFPALSTSYEPYDVKVVNPSNLYGVLYDSLTVDNIPAWTTASGSLGTYIEQSPMSVTVSAVDPVDSLSSPLIYSITSGSLPGGLSINSATGVISGTPVDIIPNTTYTFTAGAYDGRNNPVTRNFSITITDRGPSWTTAATLPAFTRNSAYSTTLVATDDNGIASYSLFSGSLPTGLTLNGTTGIISGTPTSSSAATFTIRATDNGGNYVDRQFTMPNVGPVWVSSGTITLESNGTFQLSATDDSGINPTYSIASGSLPSGVSLSSAGLLSSSSTAASSTTINLRVSDQNNNTADRSFTLVLVPYIFTSHTFTSGGTTGADGPSIGTLRSAYSSQSWAQNNSFLTMSTNGIQRWMAPQAGTYRIESAGAPGSRSGTTGGSGGIVRGDFSLSAGQYLNILVGQRGIKVNGGSEDSQPGGGGSFVWDDSNNPLVIGGGGGGAINQSTVSNSSASTNLDGVNPAGNSGGGSPTTYSSDYSQSGAGWLQNSSTSGIADTIPYRPLEGGRGGTYSGAGSHGGFGGGGCQTNSGSNRGGGGGGYTGGQGGNQSQLTVAGANFVSSSATNRTWVGSRGTEHASGYVTITKL